LTVIHPKSPTIVYTTTTTLPTTAPPAASLVEENYAEPKPAHAQVIEHSVEAKQAQTIFGNYLEGSIDERAQAIVTSGGHAVTIIIVVCVGFLVLMITLGIVRIKAAHQKASQDEVQDTEMAWDDSALNITINPMEVNFNCYCLSILCYILYFCIIFSNWNVMAVGQLVERYQLANIGMLKMMTILLTTI